MQLISLGEILTRKRFNHSSIKSYLKSLKKLMKKISIEAKRELDIFPSSKYKTMLLEIVDYNIVRNK